MKIGLSLRLLLAVVLGGAALWAADLDASTGAEAELKRLQGYWEGEGAGGKCSITIQGNLLKYRAGDNYYEATFTLLAQKEPRQLHATIKDAIPPSKSALGTVIYTIYKIDDGSLTLTTYVTPDDPPKAFDDPMNSYVVKPADPKKEKPKPMAPLPKNGIEDLWRVLPP